jgi:hypothetical protein
LSSSVRRWRGRSRLSGSSVSGRLRLSNGIDDIGEVDPDPTSIVVAQVWT